jgi:hypothetical protein
MHPDQKPFAIGFVSYDDAHRNFLSRHCPSTQRSFYPPARRPLEKMLSHG